MSEPEKHIAKFLQLKDLMQRELETMESEGHIRDGEIFTKMGKMEDSISELAQSFTDHIG